MTLPEKFAFTGPTLATTLAVNSVSETFRSLAAGNAGLQDLRIVEPLPHALAGSGNAELALHFHRITLSAATPQGVIARSIAAEQSRGECAPGRRLLRRLGRFATTANYGMTAIALISIR